MGKLVNYVTKLHNATSRAYLDRMVDEKVHCMLKAKEYEYRRLITRQGHIHEHRDGRDEVHKGVHGEGKLAPAWATRAMEYATHQQASQHDDRHQWGGHITGKAYRLSEAYHRSR